MEDESNTSKKACCLYRSKPNPGGKKPDDGINPYVVK
jgi:hypothetical protein